ncbi:MAG: response regulator transcription factor [Lachnospiraceae bacterium]|nr:response regulator transcription factor [Lachnospiraceae bacterium]
MYTIGVCDDDMEVCAGIERHLLDYAKAEKVRLEVEVFLGGRELAERLRQEELHFQLLFLDIELGDTDGITVGNILREDLENERTQIVFISHKQEYAIQLFKIRPMDFLIKPITYQQVCSILKLYQRLYSEKKLFFAYQKGKSTCQIAQDNLIYIQCDGKKIRLFTTQGEIDFYGRMADVNSQLDENRFWTIHKSFIINVDYVFAFGKEEVKLVNGEYLPVSKRCRKSVMEKLQARRAVKESEDGRDVRI